MDSALYLAFINQYKSSYLVSFVSSFYSWEKKKKHGKSIFIDPKSYIYMWQKWDANLGLHKFKAYAVLHMFTF